MDLDEFTRKLKEPHNIHKIYYKMKLYHRDVVWIKFIDDILYIFDSKVEDSAKLTKSNVKSIIKEINHDKNI